jgi:hypothetical protein
VQTHEVCTTQREFQHDFMCFFLLLELFLAEIPATSFMGSEISQANMGRQKMT